MTAEQQQRMHRIVWLVCYPPAAIALVAYIASRNLLGAGALVPGAILLIAVPLALWANCGTDQRYKARTYLYAAMLYLTGWLLLAAIGVLAMVALGSANWK